MHPYREDFMCVWCERKKRYKHNRLCYRCIDKAIQSVAKALYDAGLE